MFSDGHPQGKQDDQGSLEKLGVGNTKQERFKFHIDLRVINLWMEKMEMAWT